MDFNMMYDIAKNNIKPQKLNKHAKIGDAVCVMISDTNQIYLGVSLVATCGLGYCAEQSAISQMLNNGETRIKTILVVDKFDNILPPCGRCVELITQININNKDADIFLSKDNCIKLSTLMPYDWKDIKDASVKRSMSD